MGDLAIDYRCALSVVGTALLLGAWGLGLWVRFLVGLWRRPEPGRVCPDCGADYGGHLYWDESGPDWRCVDEQ